ncbi:MAG: DUF1045 domain-containing protein [Devosia sp.]
MAHRFALYYAPEPGSTLDRLASDWLGRPELAGETVSARRYGFHATIKAPMALKRGESADGLSLALSAFCKAQGRVPVGRIEPRIIDGFLALAPVAQLQELTEFAGVVVQQFDRFRAPLDPRERERRLNAPLSDRQIALLDRYGYPYVFEQFQFHMTLTDRLLPARQSLLIEDARRHFAPALAEPLWLDRLVVFLEPASGVAFVRGEDFVFKGMS